MAVETSGLSEYELQRLERIKENQKMLDQVHLCMCTSYMKIKSIWTHVAIISKCQMSVRG